MLLPIVDGPTTHCLPTGRSGGADLYRTRLVSTRIPAHEKRELAELAKNRPSQEWDPDACRAMLFAVLETAIRDFEYLESIRGRRQRSAAQSKRIRNMVEDGDPRAFFESSWFEEICHLLGLNHSAVRTTVAERVSAEKPLTPECRGDTGRASRAPRNSSAGASAPC